MAGPARMPRGASVETIEGLVVNGRMGRLKYATANLVLTALFYIPVIMALTRPTLGRFALLAVVGAGASLSFAGLQLLDIVALGGAAVMGVAFFVRACGNLRVLAAREPYTAP